MRRIPVARLALASTLVAMSAPLVLRASEVPPGAPADTATRPEHDEDGTPSAAAGREQHKAPAKKPATPPSSDSRYQDQPWETEFYVENDLLAHPTPLPFTRVALGPR